MTDWVCPLCGCLCDDIKITSEKGSIKLTQNACPKAFKKTKIDYLNIPGPKILNREVKIEEALEKTVFLLEKARYPLIYGLSGTTCETARNALELGELLRGSVDSSSSLWLGPENMAAAIWGEQTCSLGEVKNLGDLVIFWRCNPVVSHPRLISRFLRPSFPRGKFITQIQKTLITFDSISTSTGKISNIFLKIGLNKDFEVLDYLRGAINGKRASIGEVGGVPRNELDKVSSLLIGSRFGTIFFDRALTNSKEGEKNIEALITLIRELNLFTKFQFLPLGNDLNFRGCEEVFLSQTGYPNSVNFSRGFPRYYPEGKRGIDLLTEGICDTALIISPGEIEKNLGPRLKKIKTKKIILVDWRLSPLVDLATVFIPVARPGIGSEGSVQRMDGVPVFLKKFGNSSRPSDEKILRLIIKRLKND
ncbi:MAG: formylmethanofuran dehydrogenase subunit B [Caldiserica bacterium]|jgi:formylmethanofuran dehydrogenase subunit B|nr:formylmethanofuran dehydrogenase subunit B [Caldisericota bacterium]